MELYKIDYNCLEQLHQITSKCELLKEQGRKLSKPRLTNMEELKKLYTRFAEIIADLPFQHRPDKRTQRKLFLFIVLYLCAPSALAGKKLDKGMRTILMEIMGFSSCRAVTYHCEDLGLWYTTYPEFKQLLDNVYPLLVQECTLLGCKSAHS